MLTTRNSSTTDSRRPNPRRVVYRHPITADALGQLVQKRPITKVLCVRAGCSYARRLGLWKQEAFLQKVTQADPVLPLLCYQAKVTWSQAIA